MGRKAKRKTENKIKRHEIEFQGIIINMIRFAYDVFKCSALKFGVGLTSIAVFNGPANDYRHPGFIAVVSRLIMVEQIEFRESCYQLFIDHYPRYGVRSPERICSLLQEVIKKATSWEQLDAYARVRISLCIACELIQYLNSRGSSLYLRVLPKYWFDCYFHGEKEAFEKKGLLAELYREGIEERNTLPDRLFDQFISDQCHDYKKSAEDVTLHEKYLQCIEAYEENDLEEISEQGKTVLFVRLPEPLTSQQDEASGFDFPPNLGLLDDAAPFHNLPESSSEERPRHSRGLSAEERRRNRNYSSRPPSEQDTGQLSLDFSEMRLSSERNSSVSGAKDAAPNYNILGAKPKEPKKKGTEASGMQTNEPSLDSSRKEKAKPESKSIKSNVSVGEDAAPSHNPLVTRLEIPVEYTPGPIGVQTSISGLRPMEEQRLGQSGLDSPAKKQSKKKKPKASVAKDATPSYDLSRVTPKIAAEHSQGSSGLETDISSLRPSVDQKLGEFSLDSSVKKQPRRQKPTVSSTEVATTSRNLDTKRKSLAEYTRGSTMLQTSTSSNSSRLKQKFSSDSSGKKESREKRPNALVAEDATPSDDLPETRREIRADHSQGSSGLETCLTSLRPSVEEQLRQFSLDSSVKKELSEEKPNVFVAEDATASLNLLAAEPEEPARYSTGSSGLPTSESSLLSSLEQGLEQLSLDSSGTEKSRQKMTNKSENDPAPSYNLPPASQDPAKELGGSSSEEEKQE